MGATSERSSLVRQADFELAAAAGVVTQVLENDAKLLQKVGKTRAIAGVNTKATRTTSACTKAGQEEDVDSTRWESVRVMSV